MGRAAERNSISKGHEMGRNMVHSGNGGPERRYTGARLHSSLNILDWEGRWVVFNRFVFEKLSL